jgi:hypothetical protein
MVIPRSEERAKMIVLAREGSESSKGTLLGYRDLRTTQSGEESLSQRQKLIVSEMPVTQYLQHEHPNESPAGVVEWVTFQ